MFHRLVFTIATAFSLTGLYLVYAAAMRPVVVIPEAIAHPVETDDTDVKRPLENARVAATYISPKRWATASTSNYMFRAEEGFIYTHELWHDEENSSRAHFKPFAIVWLTKDAAGQEQAYSVVSDQATVQFASKFDEKNQNPGRLVAAILHGTVEIAGPDGLFVRGSNFYFEEEALRLYSHNPVKFQYQSHKGSATRIDMKLIPASGPPGKDRPHIFGVESIHLSGLTNQGDARNRYVFLQMKLPQGDEVRPIYAKCTGELTYTVATNTAVLTTDVIAQTGTEPYDKLECDRLTIQFVPKEVPASKSETARASDDASAPRDFQKIETNLEFSWFEAVEGKDSRVKIRSKSNGVVATMARLTYSEETRTLFMSSENSPDDVEVTRKSSTLKVPQIKIELDQQKKNVESLICEGKGEFKYFDEITGRLIYVAAWQKHLQKFTDAITKRDLVELEGNAQFRQPKPDPKDSSGILADRIRIELEPLDLSLSAADGEQESAPPDPKPKRILAEKEVALRSPQLQIKRTNELDIRFEEDVPLAALSPAIHSQSQRRSGVAVHETVQFPQSNSMKLRSNLQTAGLTVDDSQQVKSRQVVHASQTKHRQIGFASVKPEPLGSLGPPVEIPFNETGLNPRGAQQNRLQPNGRTIVSADKIGVLVRRIAGTQEIQPREVHAEGKVKITQERKPDDKPLTLVGNRVDMTMESQEQLIAQVQGTPALIRDQKFEIEGKNLHLDRGKNRAWVNGSGLLKLPLPADREIPGMDPAAGRDLIVRWDELMNFNGSQADFEGNIEAKLGHAKMTCGRMSARLVTPISFQGESMESEPALKSIHCRERVRFENSTYKDRIVTEVYRGKVGDFTLDYAAGTVQAQGPGEVFAWQKKEKNGGANAHDTIQANRPITTEVTVWNFTRLQFEGQLKGNMDGQFGGPSTRQKFDVYDRVEIVYGPVKSPTEQIDPDNLPSLAGTMRCGKLEFVNHGASEKNPTEYRTFVGRDNAEVEGQVNGRRFTASSDMISYDESKGLYVLRADGRQNARVTGIGTGNVIGRSIEFNPDPNLRMLRVERAVEGQGSQ